MNLGEDALPPSRCADEIAPALREEVAGACDSIKRRRGYSKDRLDLHSREAHEIGSDPSHEAGATRLTRTRGGPASFLSPRTTTFQAPLALAEGFARKGPSVKPCAWMVTNHVLELNQLDAIGVGLSAALHRLTRARDTRRGLAGPMRRLEANESRWRV